VTDVNTGGQAINGQTDNLQWQYRVTN